LSPPAAPFAAGVFILVRTGPNEGPAGIVPHPIRLSLRTKRRFVRFNL